VQLLANDGLDVSQSRGEHRAETVSDDRQAVKPEGRASETTELLQCKQRRSRSAHLFVMWKRTADHPASQHAKPVPRLMENVGPSLCRRSESY